MFNSKSDVKWQAHLKQLIPDKCASRLTNLALLMIAVAYQRRTLPIIRCWVDHPRGHSQVTQQIDLLKQLKPLIPYGVQVSFVGDSEFAHIAWDGAG